jgi:cyclophilin family peptidyl-prolyl cis-trans isomerase
LRRSVCIALACAAVALGACGDDEDKASSEDTGSTPPSATSEPTPTTEAAPPGGDCEQVDAPTPEERKGRKPTEPLDAGKTYRLVFATSCGEFTVTLDLKTGPKTSASLVALAEAGYFDDTAFHRIAPGFVVQGGDPSGTGSGGPGYSTRDVPRAGTRYTKGVVAMAKTGDEAPGTAGSQFFVVTGDEATFPSADYAVVGKVTNGLDVVERIGELGGPDERPLQPVVIEKVTVEESG